jgi:ABC-type sugar transport system ATPase subunit
MIGELTDQGVGVVVVTHDLPMLSIGSRATVVKGGPVEMLYEPPEAARLMEIWV